MKDDEQISLCYLYLVFLSTGHQPNFCRLEMWPHMSLQVAAGTSAFRYLFLLLFQWL